MFIISVLLFCLVGVVVSGPAKSPLLIRAARGEKVERVPVWMMRQAGRTMKDYRDLCIKHKTFRERSENADLATEISLMPYEKYKTDGCILFSDILTPLTSMGVEFDIKEKQGPVMKSQWRTADDISKVMPLMQPEKSLHFVAETLRNLRHEIGDKAAVLGFVGCPYTLASYMVEGQSSKDNKLTKIMSYENPEVFHSLLSKLADNIADYALFQIENGAQSIQLFDTWAGRLSSYDYDTFAAPYTKLVIDRIKKAHPEVPLIFYILQGGALVEKMAESGADIVSLDWTVSLSEGHRRTFRGPSQPPMVLQGNLDPMVLFGSKEKIKDQTEAILHEGGGRYHIMNLGHGIDKDVDEEKAHYFVDVVRNFRM